MVHRLAAHFCQRYEAAIEQVSCPPAWRLRHRPRLNLRLWLWLAALPVIVHDIQNKLQVVVTNSRVHCHSIGYRQRRCHRWRLRSWDCGRNCGTKAIATCADCDCDCDWAGWMNSNGSMLVSRVFRMLDWPRVCVCWGDKQANQM